MHYHRSISFFAKRSETFERENFGKKKSANGIIEPEKCQIASRILHTSLFSLQRSLIRFSDVMKKHNLFEKFSAIENHIRNDPEGEKKLDISQMQTDHDFVLELGDGETDPIGEILAKKTPYGTFPRHWVDVEERDYLAIAEKEHDEFYAQNKQVYKLESIIASTVAF